MPLKPEQRRSSRPPRRWPTGLLFVAIAVGFGGCSGDHAAEPPTTAPDAARASGVPTTTSATVPPLQAPKWLTDINPAMGTDWALVPESQRRVLEDGDLTFDEYEAAILAFIQCAADEGYPLIGELTYDEVVRDFSYTLTGAPAGQVNEAADAAGKCHIDHAAYLQGVWGQVNAPSRAERDAATVAMTACLDEAGVDSFPDPETPEFREWFRAQPDGSDAALQVAICYDEVQREFGFLPGQFG